MSWGVSFFFIQLYYTLYKMAKRALLIGCNYYGSKIPLNGCINDIVNMSHFLKDALNYKAKDILELRDDNPSSMPTKANILSTLKMAVDSSSTLSELWIHYSGHGSQIRSVDNDETDGLDEVIVPVDYKKSGFITDDELFNIIKNVKCRTILIFDSCCSGSICDLQNMFEFNGKALVRTKDAYKGIDSNPDVFVLSGCKDAQTSADVVNVQQRQYVGAFTDSLLQCLRANECNVDILKLYEDTCSYIKSKGYTQSPVLTCSSPNPHFIICRDNTAVLHDNVIPITDMVVAPVAPTIVYVQVPVPYPVASSVLAPVKKEAEPVRGTRGSFITGPFENAFQCGNTIVDNHNTFSVRFKTAKNKTMNYVQQY